MTQYFQFIGKNIANICKKKIVLLLYIFLFFNKFLRKSTILEQKKHLNLLHKKMVYRIRDKKNLAKKIFKQKNKLSRNIKIGKQEIKL